MNKTRRKSLTSIHDDITALIDRIQTELDAEQEAYDNLPEGLQEGDRGQAMLEAISEMEDAIGYLENAQEALTSATGDA
jgi:uncharacterized protein Yka (UPF0111/DUF47 family)